MKGPVVGVGLIALLLAGCSNAGLGLDSRTGVMLDEEGQIRLLYALCPGERMHVVEVAESTGGSRTDFAVPIYWRIESPSGSQLREYNVGETPEGFVETVPFVRDLPDDVNLSIEATRRWMGMSFQANHLTPGVVLRGTYDEVDPLVFENEARGECRRNQASTAGLWLLVPGLLSLTYLGGRRLRQDSVGNGRKIIALSTMLGATGAAVGALLQGVRAYDVTLPDLGMAVATGFLGGLFVGLLVGATVGLAALLRGSPRVQLGVGAFMALVIVAVLLWPSGSFVFLATPIIWSAGVALAPWMALRFEFPMPSLGLRQHLLLLGVVSLLCGVLGVALLRNSSSELSPAAVALRETGTSLDDIRIVGDVLLDVSSDERTETYGIAGGGPYSLRVVCDGPGAQVSEGYALPDRIYGIRRVLPCDGTIQSGAMVDAPEGVTVDIFVDATGSASWRLMVTR
jgi:hypothetical protein